MCKATNKVGTTELPHYVLFEGIEHHIAENIHGVFHADHSRLDRARSEAHNGLSNGDAPAENGVGEDGKKGGKGGPQRGKAGSRPETPSTPAPSAPAPPPAKKEPRESRIGINFPTKLSNRVVAAGSKVKLTCYLEGADPMVKWYAFQWHGLSMANYCSLLFSIYIGLKMINPSFTRQNAVKVIKTACVHWNLRA